MANRPLIEHVIDAASQLSPASITVVVGHPRRHRAVVRLAARNHVEFVVAGTWLGAAHALVTTEPVLRRHGHAGDAGGCARRSLLTPLKSWCRCMNGPGRGNRGYRD